MEFTNIIHSPEEEISDFKADLFIAGCGYESRSICIPQRISNISCRKIALCFTEHSKDLSRPANENYYKENNYELVFSSGEIAPDYDQIFRSLDKLDLKVMIDISVMTRTWYHSILKYLNDLNGYKKVMLRVVYCPALYSEPDNVKSKISMKRYSMLDDLRTSSKSNKSTALILGMGNEKKVSQWVFNNIGPDKTYLLYADPALQQEYVESLFVNNHSLIETVSIKNLKGYPLDNTKEMYSLLVNLILPLRSDYDVVIVPQGPKIFSLIAMVFQISYPDITLYFPKVKRNQLKDRKAYSEVTSHGLTFGFEKKLNLDYIIRKHFFKNVVI
ncbi:MAG: hypothetical protein PF450_10790 [Bacteroidales bacterium]|jgi:hypothetical protein|nr:hypothetical protein [Bacteroidales bacterium]